jgi:NADPH:quinone reductase-like Zn-dependent oxidoreductase
MRAAVHERYGAPLKVVELREVANPSPDADEVLVRIQTSSINMSDWYDVTGRPGITRLFMRGLRRPKEQRLGTDYAGIVEAVGADVTEFEAGDEVFGARTGAYADYVVAKADRAIVKKPASVSFEIAAATPVAAITALQALRDHGGLQAGQRVLVQGASGGVGTYAIQIAKALGGSVTAVCSTANVEVARSLGADRVVDYTIEDCTSDDARYDVIIDIAGTQSFRRLRRVLKRTGTVVIVGGPRKGKLVGPIRHLVWSKLAALVARQRAVFFVAKLTKEDMTRIRELLEAGELTSVIDSSYPLERVADALDHMGSGHPRGKIVVTV